MNMFTAALLLGTMVTVPVNAQNSVLFHSGINLSVAPGDADRSQVALATQQAENASAWPKPPRSALISSASASHLRLDRHGLEGGPTEGADPRE